MAGIPQKAAEEVWLLNETRESCGQDFEGVARELREEQWPETSDASLLRASVAEMWVPQTFER